MKRLALLFLTTAALCVLPACSDTDTPEPFAGADTDSEADAGSGMDAMEPQTPSTGLSTQSLSHDGVEREYLLYIPASYDGQTPMPLMLNFHGSGMSAEAQMALADMRPLADAEGFILVYPQGTLLDDKDPHWNTLLPSPDNKSTADDFGFVTAMLDALVASLSIDASRVYATGYSNGAGFAYSLACHLNDRIAAFGSVSGLMWEETQRVCEVTHPTSVIILNGTADFVRPYEGFEGFMASVDDAIAFWLERNGIEAEPSVDTVDDRGTTIERQIFEGGEGGASVVHFKLVGGGHDWFDIDVEGSDTNRLIWDFVSRHDLEGLR